MPETTKEVPKELAAVVDRVLHYHPKPVSKKAKKRGQKQKKARAA